MISPLRHLCINDDRSSFTVVFPSQYHMFKCSPFSLILTKSFSDISLGSCTTCNGTRFIAISGLPADPTFDTKCVRIYDHNQNDFLIFSHSFEHHILSMKITPTLLICAFHDHLEIWQIAQHQQVHNYKHGINVHAPCDVSNDYKYIVHSGTTPTDIAIGSLLDLSVRIFHAADNPVSLLKFSKTDKLLATTSSAGHAIKIWDPDTGECVAKFKRGNTATVIHSMDFSPDNNFVAVFSQNGTLHFFDNRNRKSGGNVSTVRSMHKIAMADMNSAIVSWFQQNKIAVLSMDGNMIVITIDENCHEIGREQVQFMQRIFEAAPPEAA